MHKGFDPNMKRQALTIAVGMSLLCGCGAFTSHGPAGADAPAVQRTGDAAKRENGAASGAAATEDRKEHK